LHDVPSRESLYVTLPVAGSHGGEEEKQVRQASPATLAFSCESD